MISSESLESTRARLAGKRIVLVLAWSVLGGAERSALSTAEYLRHELGVDVQVLALTAEDGRTRQMFSALGVPWHTHPTDWHGGRWAKGMQLVSLVRRLRGLRPDVLVPYTSRPNILCGLVWRATGASLSVWNQQDVGVPKKFGRRLLARAVHQTPLFVANSNTARDFLVSTLGAPESRVHVVLDLPVSREIGAERDVSRAELGIADGVVVVSMLAHLHAVKDHATLLQAWRLVLDERPPGAQLLLLAGRPSGTEDAVKALAFDLALGDSVRFLGDVKDVEGLLAASDVSVLTSRSESRPNALLESAAAGLPLAGTDVPGIRETVREHQAPYLAPPGDATRLAEILVLLLSDPALRTQLGDENRLIAVEPPESGPTTAELIARSLIP